MYTEDLQALPFNIPTPQTDSEVFFQDMKVIESLVKDSLLVYTAYQLKEEDALKYLNDTKVELPLLKKEASLRGVSMKVLAELVVKKAQAFKNAVKVAELLRTEFNIIYPTLTTYKDKLNLRDRLLAEFKEITDALKF